MELASGKFTAAPARWFAGTRGAAAREMAELGRSGREVFFCLCVPIFWMLTVWGLLGEGMMTKLPVGFVDHDNTETSRDIGRSLDSSRAIGLQSFVRREEAQAAMRAGSIYAIVVIPPGYSRDMLSGRCSSVVLYLDETRFAVAGTLQFEVSNVISAMGMRSTLLSAYRAGFAASGAMRIAEGVHSDVFSLGNMQNSFLAFLGGALLPGVIMVSAMLGFVTAIVRESWNGTSLQWLDSARGSVSAALTGKLAPHFVIYCILFLFYMALFAGQGGFAPAGSLLVWFLLGASCLAAFAASAVLITALAPNWRSALVVASGYAAPALPFTGFSIPLDSMGEYVRAFSLCLPLTWLMEGQSQQWTLGAEISQMGPTFLALGALCILPLAPGLYFFARRFSALAGKNAREGAAS